MKERRNKRKGSGTGGTHRKQTNKTWVRDRDRVRERDKQQ